MTPSPFVCANWKMNLTPSAAAEWARTFLGTEAATTALASGAEGVEAAIAPSFPALDRLGSALAGTPVKLAAQNFHPAESGAFTGEVSLAMLEDLGCRYILIGHSERRQLFGEQDDDVAVKAERLIESPLTPIVCVGETLDEREADATLDVVERQLSAVLERANGLGDSMVVAYEPVWAIGTGRTATPEIARAVHAAIRKTLTDHLGALAGEIRILYGGSVTPSNAGDLLSQPDIDGALVGGASLDPEAFAAILLAAEAAAPTDSTA